MSAKNAFERAVERATGESIDSLRRTPIDERRQTIEKAAGHPLKFKSRFPVIGRGNVLRDRTVDHEEAEAAFWKAVRDE